MARNVYDLAHPILTLGRIGQAQVIDVIPVIAGDSLEGSLSGVVRMSPLRRPISIDSRFDIVPFYIPHWHVYGEAWRSFIQQGVDELVTLGTITTTEGIPSIPGLQTAGTYPKWTISPLAQIWNRYIRDPRDTYTMADDFVPGTAAVKGTSAESIRDYGLPVCHLPHIANTGNREAINAEDSTLTMAVSSNNVVLQLPALQQLRARYNTEEDRSWFDRRYADIISDTWGGHASTDGIDKRPTMLDQHTQWMSGYDVDGTDDATLGSYAGKAFSETRWHMRRMVFPEHGSVWLLAFMRYPSVYQDETHYLQLIGEPSYKQIAGDPEVDTAEVPLNFMVGDIINGGSDTSSIGRHAHGQWYRTHPARVHPRFQQTLGYPLKPSPAGIDEALYDWSYTGDVFATKSLEHWQLSARFDLIRMSSMITPKQSIYLNG